MTFTISDDIYISIISLNHWNLMVFGSEFRIEEYSSSEDLIHDIIVEHAFFMSSLILQQIVDYYNVFYARQK